MAEEIAEERGVRKEAYGKVALLSRRLLAGEGEMREKDGELEELRSRLEELRAAADEESRLNDASMRCISKLEGKNMRFISRLESKVGRLQRDMADA